MYNWYLSSLQSCIIHTAQVTCNLFIALPLANPNSTYLAPSSCDGYVHLSPRLLVNCPFLSPITPAHPSPPNFHPFWVFPGPNVLLIRTHPNPFPSERNTEFASMFDFEGYTWYGPQRKFLLHVLGYSGESGSFLWLKGQ
jgi:hypothetical protein